MRSTAVLFMLGAALLAWTSVSPAGASPDEPGHIAYAWGLATGQNVNTPSEVCDPTEGACTAVVETPRGLVPTHGCHVRQIEITADCGTTNNRASRRTHIVRYPPTFYLPVGLAMRAAHGAGVAVENLAFVGRLAAAFLGWLVIAPGLAAARRLGRRTLAFGIAVLTPMTMFLTSSVNPNGVEVLGGVTAAIGVVCLLRADQVTRHNVALTLWGLLWFGWSRPMGFLWVGSLGLSTAALLWCNEPENRRHVRNLAAKYRTLLIGWAGLQALTVAWMVYSLGIYRSGPGAGRSMPAGAVEGGLAILFRWGGMFEESIGLLGWLDTPLPTWLLFGFAMGLAAMVIRSGWDTGDRRPLVVIGHLLMILAGVTLIMLRTKFLWQGRYALPPLAASFVLWGGVTRDANEGSSDRAVGAIAVILWAMTCFAGLWVGARYGFGLVRGARFLVPAMSSGSQWSGPFGWLGVLVMFAASTSVAAMLLRRTPPRT